MRGSSHAIPVQPQPRSLRGDAVAGSSKGLPVLFSQLQSFLIKSNRRDKWLQPPSFAFIGWITGNKHHYEGVKND